MSMENLETSLDELSEVINSREGNCCCIVAGDFNGDIGNKDGGRSSRLATRQGTLVSGFLHRHNLVASNMRLSATGPTHTFESHNAISTLDYIAVPTMIEDKIGECWVSDWHYLNSSDH